LIFLDTSAIYALASESDANHAAAKRIFDAILASGEPLLTHNYILVESFALISRRLGWQSAAAFANEARHFAVEWIDAETHDAAVMQWIVYKPSVSFVDQVSFLIMKRLGIGEAFAFDDDFTSAGFRLVVE